MKNQLIKLSVAGGFAVLLAALLSGCKTCKQGQPGKPIKYSIEVALDESLKDSSVIVDLVGVNSFDLPKWESYDMSRATGYWKPGDPRKPDVPGDPMRRDADKWTLNFVSGQELTQTMSITNALWGKWITSKTHVMVLADLPGAPPSRPGTQDARRQELPLGECFWPDKTKVLRVKVKRSGIEVLTQARTVR